MGGIRPALRRFSHEKPGFESPQDVPASEQAAEFAQIFIEDQYHPGEACLLFSQDLHSHFLDGVEKGVGIGNAGILFEGNHDVFYELAVHGDCPRTGFDSQGSR
jgi:hypothetical protein